MKWPCQLIYAVGRSRPGNGMKWKSHTAIARAIAEEMGLPDDLEEELCEGSVDPDRRPDAAMKVDRMGRTFIGRAPHHDPPAGIIMSHAWRSREAYLRGDGRQAVRCLGRALHYIQDKSVSPGLLDRSHDLREEDIADLVPPREAVRKGIDMAVCSPLFVRECVRAVRPRQDPREAMYQATLFSAAIFASVLGPPDSEGRFISDYGKARRNRRCRYAAAGMAAASSILISLLLTQPLALIAGAAAVLAAVLLDHGYHDLREEAEWFGIRPR